MAGRSDLGLRLNYWYLNHRDQLLKWWVVSFIILDVLLLTAWAVTFLVARKDGSAVLRQLTARVGTPLFEADARAALAHPLTVETPVAVSAGSGTVDLLVEFVNENEGYVAESVRYRFRYGSTELPERETFLRPDSRRFVFESNVPTQPAGTSVELLRGTIQWRRPTDPELLSQVGFRTVSLNLDRSATTSTTPPQPAPRVTATMTNDSVFSFRQVEVSVAVLNQGQPVAADRLLVNDWESFADRQLSTQWIRTIPSSAEVVAIPQVNPLDRANRYQP
ncbi:MAG: hypothetical protein HYZ09_00605 [Candidatus Kerfeldbacteria bacterium]|nr:hypothetical protein [Candidatus Kerfeldbacteria bacterium]